MISTKVKIMMEVIGNMPNNKNNAYTRITMHIIDYKTHIITIYHNLTAVYTPPCTLNSQNFFEFEKVPLNDAYNDRIDFYKNLLFTAFSQPVHKSKIRSHLQNTRSALISHNSQFTSTQKNLMKKLPFL